MNPLRQRAVSPNRYPHMSSSVRPLFTLVCGLSSLWFVSCKSCEREKPYTPFKVASAPHAVGGAAHAPEAGPQAAAGAPAFAPKTSEIAPKGATTWHLGDQDITAPAGLAFERAVSGDFNNDGRLEVVAWLNAAPITGTTPPVGPPLPQVGAWLFEAGAPPRQLAGVPGFVPSAEGCQRKVELAQTGAHSVTLDIRAECQTPLIARAPTRALLVLAPMNQHTIRLTLRIAAAAPGETLDVSVDSQDRDGDQSDDVQVMIRVGEQGAPNTSVSAPLVWLDRASGLARDPSEPSFSLWKAAQAPSSRSLTAAAAQRAASTLDATVRYFASVCAESGTFRVTDADGGAVRCNNMDKVAFRVLQTRVRLALKQKKPLFALAALATRDWFFANVDSAATKKLTTEFTKTLLERRAQRLPIAAMVQRQLPSPRYSPLTFDSNGLLLLSDTGVVRITTDGTVAPPTPGAGGAPGTAGADNASAESNLSAWPLSVASPSGQLFTGITLPCDSPFVSMVFSDSSGVPQPPVASSFLAPRPGACNGHKGPLLPSVAPLGFKGGQLHVLFGALPIAPVGQPFGDLPVVAGSPRSPDGKWLVVPTNLGLFVDGPTPQLWTPEPARAITQLSDCVIQNGGERVACLEAGRPVLFEAQGALARSK